MKIGLLGDKHVRKVQHHAELFEDRRIPELLAVDDTVVEAFKDCDLVIQAGDFLDSRDASPEEIRMATEFLERFGDKKVRILSGNHASNAAGKAAEDFINELSGKNWQFVNEIYTEDGICYVPYMRRQQFGVQTDEEVVQKVLENIDDILALNKAVIGDSKFKAIVIHHAIAGTKTASGQMTDLFHEAVFPQDELLKRAHRVFGAHIHEPQRNGNVWVIGSAMAHEIGETTAKRVLVWDERADVIDSVPLPGRRMVKLTEPSIKDIREAKLTYDLVKVVTSDPEIAALADITNGIIVQEAPKTQRERSGAEVDAFDFSIPVLLEAYAKENGIEEGRLAKAFSKIE